MIQLRPQDAYHKSQLLRLLIEIVDHPLLSQNLYFKGGTCAAMLGYLDRFSVDLDFDLKPGTNHTNLRAEFLKIFTALGLEVKDQSKVALEFFLRYATQAPLRNTIKLDALDAWIPTNIYEAQYLPDIDRVVQCQTIETMFAHKLVAPLDRFEKHKSIAGRDIYDIHSYYLQGNHYIPEIIQQRTKLDMAEFLQKLISFLEKHITETLLNQDLNTLLSEKQFQSIRKILKTETLTFLRNDLDVRSRNSA